MKPLSLLSLLLISFILPAQIVINEYSCSNINQYVDADNEYHDWIELYNPSNTVVNLNGLFLSDKLNNLSKWALPNSNIPSQGYLLIFASGKDGLIGPNYHTNFKLTQTKFETIFLTNAASVIQDSVTINPTLSGHSRGRFPDGSSSWSLFIAPSAQSSNLTSSNDYLNTVTFSQNPGFYNSAITLNLLTTQSNVDIRYTTDGSEPTSSSLLYSGSLSINNTTVVKTKAFSQTNANPPSFTETNTYFINNNHSTYVLSIAGDQVDDLLNGNFIEPEGTFELFDPLGNFVDESTGYFNKHGNDSWAYAQRGFDFISKDQLGYNHAITHNLFPTKNRKKFQRLIVKAAANDNYPFEPGGAHIRDSYVHTLSQLGNLKIDERSSQSCVLYLNGQYWGVYDIREKVDDHDFTDYYYDQDKNNIDFIKTWGNTWAEYGDQNDWNNLYTYITTNDMAIQTNYDSAISRLNHKSLIDYIVLNSYVVCADWLVWNTAWWRGKDPAGDKKKYRYALWDMDATFGHYINYTGIPDPSANADPCDPEDLDQFADPEGHITILNALMVNPDFQQYYISRYIDLSNTTFSCNYMIHVLDSMVAVIDPEMQNQINTWGGSYSQWQANVQTLRDFINDRCSAMETGLKDCYNLRGPYPITFDVEPALSGTIKINSITPNNYPYSGTYYGGIQLLLKARANNGFTFSHWELDNHLVNPDTLTTDISLMLDTTDLIIAHFIKDSSNITLLVDPINSGLIDYSGTVINNFPYNTNVSTNSNISLEAIANAGFDFSYWSSNHHSFNPDDQNTNVQVLITKNDTIIAHFLVKDSVATPTVPTQYSNILTPNGDGLNDYFNFEDENISTDFELNVFDRWGKLVYQTSDINDPWKGQNADHDGTFYYTIGYLDQNSEAQTQSGYITLLHN